jgi:tRNA 5-methylaminomethyl-2-thiouridine biosynthesis bifunctional protein
LTINHAQLRFNDKGTPIAEIFNDLYFSNLNGLEESEYVFLGNNGLPLRWQSHPHRHFVIAETGFGTGLNFLLTARYFSEFLASHPETNLKQLHYISFEQFPLTKDDLIKALSFWPQLNELTTKLLKIYPQAIPGCHRLMFSETIMLDLWLGDAEKSLTDMHNPTQGLVDAWYLDGFAPAKNPSMWTPLLFERMAELSRNSATFSTFTAAGVVKRGLADAGFNVEKRKGFAHKRDMLAGDIQKSHESRPSFSAFFRNAANFFPTQYSSPSNSLDSEIMIVGAGIAAACLAKQLSNIGKEVSVCYATESVADGASGNHIGGFYPLINASINTTSLFHIKAQHYAWQLYNQLHGSGYPFGRDWCGTLLVGHTEDLVSKFNKMVDASLWPESLIGLLSAEQASEKAGIHIPYPSMWLPLSGWVCPSELVSSLFAASSHKGVKLFNNKELTELKLQQDRWILKWKDGTSSRSQIVILACGEKSAQLSQLTHLPLRPVRGQVENVQSTHLEGLQTLICHKGYLTPAYKGSHALGSTYIKDKLNTAVRREESLQNIRTLEQGMSECDWGITEGMIQSSRASIRCTTPDHLPIAGSVPDLDMQKLQYADGSRKSITPPSDQQNLYVLTGLGSRGLVTAPILAETICCQINGKPLPFEKTILSALNPNRFLIRNLPCN